ncbi:hypothetical protein CK203_057391 [Vitis vinifera]|uniref:Uncharacterized protein n=1 Tax=Vitis vinifera TaxID=29760 RepID=A0A438FUH6_VITVI|nr:hypothetical protein CK203_057391 [Vitis vinifera]
MIFLFPSDEEDAALGGLPNSLGISCSPFSSVFENLSEDQHSTFEAPGSRLAVIVSGRPLLVVGHPNGCTLSYFVHPVQISS